MMDFLKGFKTLMGLTPLLIVFLLNKFGYTAGEAEIRALVDLTITEWTEIIGALMTWYGVLMAKIREIKATKQ